jgi:hypothetical protein
MSAYWRTDFDTDPTTSDVNGDGVADWQAVEADEVIDSAPYDADSLVAGVWHVTGKLQTQPTNDFASPTTVEVSFRSSSIVNVGGAVAWINADWGGGLHAPLALGVFLQADGTQSLWLMGKTDESTEVTLCEQHNMSDDFIVCRLTILPEYDLVNVRINDADLGTFSYPTYATSSTDRFLSVYGDTTHAEFDYVEVRVSESN